MLCSRIDEMNIWDPLAWESENTTSLSYWEIHFNLDSSRKKLFPPKILNTSSLNSFEKKKQHLKSDYIRIYYRLNYFNHIKQGYNKEQCIFNVTTPTNQTVNFFGFFFSFVQVIMIQDIQCLFSFHKRKNYFNKGKKIAFIFNFRRKFHSQEENIGVELCLKLVTLCTKHLGLKIKKKIKPISDHFLWFSAHN